MTDKTNVPPQSKAEQRRMELLQVKIVPPQSKAEQRRMELLLLEDFVAKGNTVTELPASKRRRHAKTFKR